MTNPCACGHEQDDHQPDCVGVLRPDVFCECSGFRAEGVSSDSRFRGGHLEAVQRDRMPAWMALAECRKHSMPGQPWAEAFRDDPAYQADPDKYQWPASVVEVMRVCSTCPVRRECLDYAYETTKPQSFGDVSFYTPHREACDEDCTEHGVHRVPFELEQQHEGVYGGTPGPIRQHFQDRPDLAEAWFTAWTRKRGWDVADTESEECG